MKEELRREKYQEIAAVKEECRKQVNRRERVTKRKLAEQRKVCNIISVYSSCIT